MASLLSPLCPLLAVIALTGACGGTPAPAPTAAPHRAAWSYAGATGPTHWGDLDPSYAACSHGTKQSPIDLPRPSENPLGLAIASPHWDPVPLSIVNNGHTVQIDDAASSSLVLDGVTYSLVQFHFHTPAEHTLAGRAFDAELHLVHRAPGGEVAVIALFFQKGAENVALRPLFDAIPMEPGPPRSIPGKTIDLGALVPPNPRFLSYVGSLTAPPCTEDVHWLVALPDPTPLELLDADLAKLRAAMHAPTNRPPQPGNDRVVELRSLENRPR